MDPLVLTLLLAALLLGAAGLRRVPVASVVTVHRFGRYRRALGPGWRWVLPGVDRLGPPVSLIGHHLAIPAQAGTAADLYFQILDPARAGAALDDVDAMVSAQARDALAALPAAAPGPAEALRSELNRRVARLGLRVVRCSLHTA